MSTRNAAVCFWVSELQVLIGVFSLHKALTMENNTTKQEAIGVQAKCRQGVTKTEPLMTPGFVGFNTRGQMEHGTRALDGIVLRLPPFCPA